VSLLISIRIYVVSSSAALLVLAEYTIMSIVLYLSFAHPIEVNTCTTFAPLQSNEPVQMSYCAYFAKICNVLDVWHNLSLKKVHTGVTYDSTERLLMGENQKGFGEKF
jgi:hypothetical protein